MLYLCRINKKQQIMENLHPVAQVVAIIMLGLVAIAYLITLNNSWKDIFKKK